MTHCQHRRRDDGLDAHLGGFRLSTERYGSIERRSGNLVPSVTFATNFEFFGLFL